MGWKKMIFGEKMPDKDDPQYKERRERENKAGRNAAKVLRVDKAAAKTQRFASKYPKIFLLIVFGLVVGCLGYNIRQMVRIYNQPTQTAVESQHGRLRQKGVIKQKSVEKHFYEEQQKALKDEIDFLTGEGYEMTNEDSLRVKFLLEQLVRVNNNLKE